MNHSSPETIESSSPMMRQWHACKQAAGTALLLFRLGDFYEAFHEDAIILAKELELTLTQRQDIPMSGIPHHTSDAYIDRLVSKGYRVAIAEQTEDPKQAKGLVKREIVRMVTPGTIINSSLLSEKNNNFFGSIARVGSLYALSVLDLTTADFRVFECEKEQDLLNELFRLQPAELLISHKFEEKNSALITEMKQNYDFLVNVHEDWFFEHKSAYDCIASHLGVIHLDGFGLKGMVAGINAAGALLRYLRDILSFPISHIKEIHPYSNARYMALDRNTQRHLELIDPLNEGDKSTTLVGLLDHTHTPMGARLLRHWIKHPLLDMQEIHQRQDAIEAFLTLPALIEQLSHSLNQVRDMERLIMRISSGHASPRDLVALRSSFIPIEKIKTTLHLLPKNALMQQAANQLDPLPEMVQLIAQAIVDEPPARLSDGGVIRTGFHQELDELRTMTQSNQAWLANYQTKLREEIGIKTLKVGFSRMAGYYLEVSKGQSALMPPTFQRRQTLTNAERYLTPELKQYESKMFTAEDRITALENELFHSIRHQIIVYADRVMQTARSLAVIDCVRGLAETARTYRYVRPIIDKENIIHIVEGRHPVIETSCIREKFVPNDVHLDDEANRLLILTGPNMAGKSTYIRQIALITIMAQIGSFVPAQSAQIGIIDKVFTRIGASDNLARGYSTFMVEMTETANILNNVTSRSLVLLDEIGRGTSTYDGISIAWAVAEHLLLTEDKKPKTLFATHYWELTKMEGKIPGAVNYNVAVHESQDEIRFLHKVVRGGTDKSYGIHVARLAGLPSTVISRAREILQHLEENANRKTAFEPPSQPKPKKKQADMKNLTSKEIQLTFFEP